jgi:hypothetical protein
MTVCVPSAKPTPIFTRTAKPKATLREIRGEVMAQGAGG